MNSEIRIPTLLGLGLLLVGLGAGVFLVTQNRFLNLTTKAGGSQLPKNITVTSISSTQASIYWQSDEETATFIQAGPSPLLGLTFRDDRDPQTPLPHRLHFMTIKNLNPATTYYYKITSGGAAYPSGIPLSFKTASALASSELSPLIGTVLDSNSRPVKEALVTLDIPGAQGLAAVTKAGGNFILPLNEIHTADLGQGFAVDPAGVSVKLTVSNPQGSSHITFILPFQEITLPPIILGQDLDLTPVPTPAQAIFAPEDLNRDKVVNSFDLAILRKSFGQNPVSKQADLNHDGVVNQKDLDILNQVISTQSARRAPSP